MNISRITDYVRGWFIGNFEPSLLKTPHFEVGVLNHKKGEYWAPHYHKESIEYNVCLLYTSPSPRDRQKSRMPSSA